MICQNDCKANVKETKTHEIDEPVQLVIYYISLH